MMGLDGGRLNIAAAALGGGIGQLFNGTLVPLAGGITVMSILAFALMLYMGRLESRRII